jgi:hypothetical protein
MKNGQEMINNDAVWMNDEDIKKAYENYFGVCDVTSPEQALAMAEELRKDRVNPNRKIMIGVMTHPLALNPEVGHGVPELDRVREVFPTREQLASGFIDDPDVLNTVHYADLYGPRKGQNLPENLESVVKYGGENLHAIQLDVTWPKPDEIKEFKDKHPQLLIILQLGTFAFEAVNKDPEEIVRRLHEYGDSVDFALFDMSMGKGKAMESEWILPMLRLIKSELPYMGLAVAGGLGPDSIDLLGKIATEFPGISIDAQGLLKPLSAPKDKLGHILSTVPADPARSKTYIEQSCKMLDGHLRK